MSCSGIILAQEIELQVPDRRYEIPDGYTLEPGTVLRVSEEIKCFNVDEYRTLANVIIDYRWLYDALTSAQIAINAEREKNKLLNQEIKILNSDIMALKKANTNLGWLLDKQLDASKSQLRGDKLKLYAVAAIAILELVAIGALGTAYGIEKR